MKRFLIFILVLCFVGAASATTVSFIAPEEGAPGSASNPLELGEALTLYIGVSDSQLYCLGMNITGNGITGGILASEAPEYGVKATYFAVIELTITDGGWQLAYDTTVTGGTKAEIDLYTEQEGNVIYGPTTEPVKTLDLLNGPLPDTVTINTPIAYITIVGTGTDEIYSMANKGYWIQSSYTIYPSVVPDFGGPITIYGIPEPMTVVLLSLGGLFLRRRK